VSGENDMTVKDNLIAAKALIDTPKKLANIGGVVRALALVSKKGTTTQMVGALRSQGLLGGEPHEIIMAAFDRAIAAQEA
jgi:hypothetical protein